VRHRRILMGMTQQQLAAVIGVACQQAHKYEKGISRMTALRLCRIAGALGVQVGYFHEGLPTGGGAAPSPSQRAPLASHRSGHP